MSWITTLDGKAYDLDASGDASVINIDTIATAHSRQIRFGNHCLREMTTAQHAVMVSDIVGGILQHKGWSAGISRDVMLAALLHDAHEVYWGFGDVASPAKQLDEYVRNFLRMHARRTDALIAKRFCFPQDLFYMHEVGLADKMALAIEIRDNMAPCDREYLPLPEITNYPRLQVLTRHDARLQFLARFHKLQGESV